MVLQVLSVSKLNYYTKTDFFPRMDLSAYASKSISLLIVSALLVLPSGIAFAGNIDVQTNGVRVTVGKNGGINIQSRPSGVNIIPQHRAWSFFTPPTFARLNRTSKQHLD